jgi:hypothetical protein
MDQIVNERQQVLVFPGYHIERVIILDESQLTVLLLDEEDGHTNGRLRRADATGRESVLKECVHLLLLIEQHQVHLVGRCAVNITV